MARQAVQYLGGVAMPLGDCVAIQFEGISVVLNSNRTQAFSPHLFTAVGIDPEKHQTVIVKSTQHFYAAFAPIATDVAYVAAPVVVAPDFTVLDYQYINRPKWPFDPLNAIPE